MSKLRTMARVARTFALRDGALRLSYELQRSSGFLSGRMRAGQGWDRWQLRRVAPGVSPEGFLWNRQNAPSRFFFSGARSLQPELQRILGESAAVVLADADRILAGTFPFFGGLSVACGFPPNWFRNPLTGQQVSPERPWTTMRFASPDYGDLKFILEPSRFFFVYPLARAYFLSGDERFPETFWRLVEDWARHSPPMSGPLWVCGQESSLRILAWSFAFHAFLHATATTAERSALLVSMIAAHAWRAEQTLGYARSQRSNHLFSEAVGLWTAGRLFPELADAARWRETGLRLLQEAASDQITPEGVHLQFSFNYQRMVLQLCLWVIRLAQIHGTPVPELVHQRTQAAFELLRTFVDPISGLAPNYGANDGTLILPLSCTEFSDFRPLIQSASQVLTGKPALNPGPWDEAALWLGVGVSEQGSPRQQLNTPAPEVTGYHRLGNNASWAMVRAAHYLRRPFQADQLHVDLWHNGVNVARDPGTYRYNGEPPWDNGLARTCVHNTITVDGRDQMQRAGRFLWVDWAQASGESSATGGGFPDHFEGEHDGYMHLGVRHRRSVRWLESIGWVIIDDLLGGGEHEADLHWLLPDLSFEVIKSSWFQVSLRSEAGTYRWNLVASTSGYGQIIRAGKSCTGNDNLQNMPTLGWHSPTYGELLPAVSLLYHVRASFPVRLVSVLLLEADSRFELEGQRIEVWRGEKPLYNGDLSISEQETKS